jgi:hypothetical protein
MIARLGAAAAILLWAGQRGFAHRLDEYLQATTISVEKARVQAQLRLTPGVAVYPIVLAIIDTNSDGVISKAEQQAYANGVLRDVSLTIDGRRLPLRLTSTKFARTEEMKEGLGEIQINFEADAEGGGGTRELIFENHHQSRMAAYMVNCLAPRDRDIRITRQDRNYEQSFYRLDYAQGGAGWGRIWVGIVGLILSARFAWLWRGRKSGGRGPRADQGVRPTSLCFRGGGLRPPQ